MEPISLKVFIKRPAFPWALEDALKFDIQKAQMSGYIIEKFQVYCTLHAWITAIYYTVKLIDSAKLQNAADNR